MQYNTTHNEEFLSRLTDPVYASFNDNKKALPPSHTNKFSSYYGKILSELRVPPGYGTFVSTNGFRSGRRTKDQVTSLNCHFYELDFADKTEENARAKGQAILELLASIDLIPTTIIETLHGFHVWWLFTEPISVFGDKDEKAIAWMEYQNRIVYAFGGDDSAKDISRVLRVPGTENRKVIEHPYVCHIIHQNDITYTPDEFRTQFEKYEATLPQRPVHKPFPKAVASVPEGRSFPGDIYDKNATWEEILIPHGWKFLHTEGHVSYWTRPDKETGVSATTNFYGNDQLVIFSSNALPFSQYAEDGKTRKGYTKFSAYTLLNHNGDFSESTKAVALMYPQDNSVEKAQGMLKEIPSDIEKVKLVEALTPILKNLTALDKMVAESFIMYTVKEHFKITKEEAKKYITRLNSLRNERVRNEKEQKVGAEKKPLILDRDIDFQEVLDAVSEVGIVSKETLYILTSFVISAKLRLNPPLWMFLIGVPSSNKTENVSMYGDMLQVFTLDTLTENAFVSGYVPPDGSEPQDMLPLLDNKCFIVKDLNTIFSLNEEMVKKILGDLTSIFDGTFEKFTATRGMLSYSSSFSMIGCITPSILIKHYNYATQLGPRFFFLRLPDLTEEQLEKSFNRSWSEPDRKGKIAKARQLVSSYATQLINKIEGYELSSLSKEVMQKINSIALFMSKARGIAISNKNTFQKDGGDVTYYDVSNLQIEQPWRILNQLKSLLKVLAFMRNKEVYDKEEIQIIKPIILSTMPVDRAEILGVLAQKSGMSARDLSKEIGGKSIKTIQRSLKELEVLGLVDAYKDPHRNNSGKAPWLYFVHPKFADVIDAPTPSQESLSELKSEKGNDSSKNEEDDSF